MKKLLAMVMSIVLLLPVARAEDAAASKMDKQTFLASLHFKDGTIELPGNIATLHLPANFRYLPPADSARLLEAWGNPPDSSVLGMIVPATPSVLDQGGWAVVVTYDKDGHIKDDDAEKINYDSLLKDMQESIKDSNAERKKQGYAGMSLQGWAERPSYDKATHKMVWAKQIRFDDTQQDTLNYNVRVLGREGVLVLNAVADAGQIGQVKQDMQVVTGFTDFTAGNRYADFNDKTDKIAEYGLAALVAGGVAAKLGLFGKLFAFLLVFKKLIFVAVAALGATAFKWFKREPATPAPEAPPAKVSLEKKDAGDSAP